MQEDYIQTQRQQSKTHPLHNQTVLAANRLRQVTTTAALGLGYEL